jgi:hypothetical protein
MLTKQYSNAVAEQILDEVAQGSSLVKATEKLNCDRKTVYRWVWRNLHGFAEKFRDARRMGTTVWAEEVLDLSDESRCASGDMALLGSYKLRVDSRKWLLAKLHPELYGEAVQHSIGGSATIVVTLPAKGSDAPLLEGSARLLEDQSED